MTACFDYPSSARFGRIVPKSKVYAAAGASSKVQRTFVEQVDQIVWQFKLAPETINLNATPAVPEIQVFAISLRTPALDDDVLRAIDKAITFPTVFELTQGDSRRMVAAYKRRSEADSTKWVVSSYFESDWEPEDSPRKSLPNVLDLGALYDRLLTGILPGDPKAGERLPERVARVEAIRTKERDTSRIKARLAREKQFNKKVAINAELRAATRELKQLSGHTGKQDAGVAEE